MITLLATGTYQLIETKGQTKILYLEDAVYAWVQPVTIGEILVVSHKPHKTDCVLATGDFRLFDVSDEAGLSTHQHLELAVGENTWQGYLLPNGLPNRTHKRRLIIPTHVVVSGNQYGPGGTVSQIFSIGMKKGELL